MTYFLKIHSGYQANACLPINVLQSYTIGNKYGSNIFLCIDGVEEQEYCQFQIGGENTVAFINLKPGLDFNIIGSQNQLEANLSYTLPIFIEISGIKLAIGQQAEIDNLPNKQQESIGLNDILNDDTTTDTNAVLEVFDDVDSLQEAPISENLPKIASRLLNKLTIFYRYLLKQAVNYAKLIHDYIGKQKRVYIYTAAGIILLLFLSILVMGQIYTKTKSTEIATKQDTSTTLQIKQKYNKLPPQYSNLVLMPLDSGRFNLSGLVKNDNEHTFITNYFADYRGQIKFSLIDSKNAIVKVSNIINGAQVGKLQVGYDNASRQITLKGFALNYANLDDAEISINSQFPMIGQIDVAQVFDVNEVSKDIKKILANDFEEQTTVNQDLENSTITIQGFLDKTESAQIQQKIDVLKQKYPILVIQNQIKDISNALPFKIFSVYTGQPSYITTDGGLQVFEGGVIKGFKLQSISSAKLVFVGKYQIVIPLDRLTNTTDNMGNNDNSGNSQSTPKSYNNMRNQLLLEEKNTVESAISNEESQLVELNAYKDKVTDTGVKKFIEQLISNLQDDLTAKKQDLQRYLKVEQS